MEAATKGAPLPTPTRSRLRTSRRWTLLSSFYRSSGALLVVLLLPFSQASPPEARLLRITSCEVAFYALKQIAAPVYAVGCEPGVVSNARARRGCGTAKGPCTRPSHAGMRALRLEVLEGSYLFGFGFGLLVFR